MKNLVRILTFSLVSLFIYQANAQNIAIKGGLNLAKMLQKDDKNTYSDDQSMKLGFHVGATADFPINDFLSFEPGLFLTTKGFKDESDVMGAKTSIKTSLYYLDVPLTLKASHDLGDLKIYGAAGPYVGFGLSGKTKSTVEFMGKEESGTEDIKWGSGDDDDLKRLDFGLTIGAGVEISAFIVGLSYDLGLANISPYQDNGTKIKNRVLKLSVGYKL